MRRNHAHRSSQLREALDIVAFFVAVVVIVLFLSLDGIH